MQETLEALDGIPTLVLMSGADQYVPSYVDKDLLTQRIAAAAGAHTNSAVTNTFLTTYALVVPDLLWYSRWTACVLGDDELDYEPLKLVIFHPCFIHPQMFMV